MSGKLIIMAGLAVAFGATSYVAGNHYLESQTQARLNALENERPSEQAISLTKVVVATENLGFGTTLEPGMLKLVDWPSENRPEGVFNAVEDVIADGKRRVITPMLSGEPVLQAKLTGENGRAGLAGIIKDGMRAVTIPVNMVDGVGGFVQPGDYVDLVLTREDNEDDEPIAKILMENVKVLTVDQQAGERSETAQVAQSVTLETNTEGAKKIALARNIGQISLLLRSAGDAAAANKASMSASDLDDAKSGGFLSFLEPEEKTKSIRVIAGPDETVVTVPIEAKMEKKLK